LIPIKLFQIFYDEATRSGLEPGFLPLDNLANPRPDWREYWPIRNYLLTHKLKKDSYYGFFSPRFREKSELSAADVEDFVRRTKADVAIFTPPYELHALFWNVFQQGEYSHPGFAAIAGEFLRAVGQDITSDFVTDSRNTVYSNYFVARSGFWNVWLALAERLFAMAENPSHPLAPLLNRAALYRGAYEVQHKVFIVERLASLLLAKKRQFVTATYVPKRVEPAEAIACDALKIAYTQRPDIAYRQAFNLISQRMISAFRSDLPEDLRGGDEAAEAPAVKQQS
jgi:hypothetical protein